MKNNTYDAPGYKYGFMIVPDDDIRKETNLAFGKCKNMEEAINVFGEKIMSNALLCDFKQIDGLTFEELFDFPVFNEKILIFCIYDQLDVDNHKYNNILGIEFISTDYIDDKKEKVDDYLSSYLEDIYHFRPPRIQDYIKGYLERYKYGSKEEVDKVLRKIND